MDRFFFRLSPRGIHHGVQQLPQYLAVALIHAPKALPAIARVLKRAREA